MNVTGKILPGLLILLVSIPSIISAETTENEYHGRLTKIPGMEVSRYNHTAVQFDNKIIVAGGTEDGYSSLSSCEILDTSSMVWNTASNMEYERMRHCSVRTGDNSILVSGGFQGKGHPSLIENFNGEGNLSLSSCEIYRPSLDIWEPFPSMIHGRFWHAMIFHPTLGIIIIGGLNTTTGALSSCERFNGISFEYFPSLPEPRARFAYCILDDGDIIVAGGHEGIMKKAVNTTFRYDMDSGKWTEAAPLIHPRGYPGFTLLENGTFAVSGGFSEPGSPDRSDSEIYNHETDTWTDSGSLLFPRHGHGMVDTGNGYIVIAGGSNCETGGCHSNLEIFDKEEGIWTDSGHLIMGRKWCTITNMGNNSVVVLGGKACNYPTADTELLDMSNSDPVDNYSSVRDIDLNVLILIFFIFDIMVSLVCITVKWRSVQ